MRLQIIFITYNDILQIFMMILGTQEIYIQSKIPKGCLTIGDRKGLIAIWRKSMDKIEVLDDDRMKLDAPMMLQILVTDNTTVYGALVDDSKLFDGSKSYGCSSQKGSLVDYLLNGDHHISYDYLLEPNQSICVQLTVENFKFQCLLQSIGSDSGAANLTTERALNKMSSQIEVSVMLINSLHSLFHNVKKLQDQTSKWKYVANQWDDKLQNEKNTLLENFLKLYEHMQDQIRTCRHELAEERRKSAATGEQDQFHNTSSKTREDKGKKTIWDDDSHGFVQYDSDEVERLAQGPQRRKMVPTDIAPVLDGSLVKNGHETANMNHNHSSTWPQKEPNTMFKFEPAFEKSETLLCSQQNEPSVQLDMKDDDSDSEMSAILL